MSSNDVICVDLLHMRAKRQLGMQNAAKSLPRQQVQRCPRASILTFFFMVSRLYFEVALKTLPLAPALFSAAQTQVHGPYCSQKHCT